MRRRRSASGPRRRDGDSALAGSRLLLLVLATVVTVVGLAGSTTATAGADARQAPDTGEIDIELSLGVAGVVPNVGRIPVRATITAPRSRTVRLELDNGLGRQFYEVQLNAGAPTVVDAVLQAPVNPVEATIRDSEGTRLGHTAVKGTLDPAVHLVLVGASVAGHREPWSTESTASIQKATMAPLAKDLLDRPGVLDAAGGMVLGPDDIQRLTDTQARRISAWVAAGGNLALDQARTDPLPVLGTPAEPGDRTAVEGGWVRFTGGAAARGEWTAVVEPAAVPDNTRGAQGLLDNMGVGVGPGMGMDDFFGQQLENTGFLQISYLSSSVIVAAVFATSILVGPILWLLLRDRRRRRWMWGLAPALSVGIATLLTVTGQGVLSDASTSALGGGLSTRWSTSGEFGVGVKEDETVIDLGNDGQVWASGPRATTTGAGDDRRARQTLGANGFGYAGIGVVPVADEALVTASATPRDDGRIDVTVTNRSEAGLTEVSISGFTRSRGFDDIPAGESRTRPFEIDDDLTAFGQLFPVSNDGRQTCIANFCFAPGSAPFSRTAPLSHAARGRIEVRGLLHGTLSVAGISHPNSVMHVIARTAVTAPAGAAPPDASLRLESVGVPPGPLVNNGQGGVVVQPALPDGGIGPSFADAAPIPTTSPAETTPPTTPPAAAPGRRASGRSFGRLGAVGRTQPDVPTTTVVAVAPDGKPVDPGTSFSQEVLPEIDPVDVYALMSSPVDRDAIRCSAHTVVNSIDEWRDGAWAPVAPTGDPLADGRFLAPNETRAFQFGPLAAGETRFLRLSVGLPVLAASAMTCSGVAA